MSQSGKLIVISGPSGVGKSVVCNELLALPGFRRVVTCTTRDPRDGEVDGRHYHFLCEAEFQERVARRWFLEHAKVHDRRYGTPREAVEEGIRAGDFVLLNIDVQGAARIREVLEDAQDETRRILRNRVTSIFLLPPDLRELERRLAGRGTDSEEEVKARLERAIQEINEKDQYDYQVVNGELSETVREILARVGYPGEARVPAR